MPPLGDTFVEGKIIRWLKQEGEMVRMDEPVVEIETQEVIVELRSSGGLMRRIIVAEGKLVTSSMLLAVVGSPDEPMPDPLPESVLPPQPVSQNIPAWLTYSRVLLFLVLFTSIIASGYQFLFVPSSRTVLTLFLLFIMLIGEVVIGRALWQQRTRSGTH